MVCILRVVLHIHTLSLLLKEVRPQVLVKLQGIRRNETIALSELVCLLHHLHQVVHQLNNLEFVGKVQYLIKRASAFL